MRIGLCECCGEYNGKLEWHHWYEPPFFELESKYVCWRCNNLLKTHEIFGLKSNHNLDHVMPRWELQVAFVKAFDGEFQLAYKNAIDTKSFDKSVLEPITDIINCVREEYRYLALPPIYDNYSKYCDTVYWEGFVSCEKVLD